MNKLSLSILLYLSLSFVSASAENGDIHHIISHDKEMVITDPSKGENFYHQTAVFPPDEIEYRRAILNITYACPDGLHCGEWDYIDNVYLRLFDTKGADTLDLEIARIISPYGWRFDSLWSFTWDVDITEFAPFLHDSAEIVFRHSGYEKNDDRGWLVTLDFELIEGRPSANLLDFDTLWCGSFKYGDTSDPIESHFTPVELKHEKAEMVKLRITQTGHGMDDYENCAEFCEKYRMIFLDSQLVDYREIWKQCGDNPLYPQAGTWIFDRAGWCPGQAVEPDVYTFELTPDSSRELNIDMEPYTNPKNPSANYAISTYLFYYDKPWAKNDVSLEKIIVPSDDDMTSRVNPACNNPIIEIKNMGSETLEELTIHYGLGEDLKSYRWRGLLTSQEKIQVTLPGSIENIKGSEFVCLVENPNGVKDEYEYDNSATSNVILPDTFPNRFIMALKTNNQAEETGYRLIDNNGKLIAGRELGTLMPDSLYLDSFDLAPGCYQLMVTDTAGDGLEFWFNGEGGYGYVRLLDMNGRLIKSFNSDFGDNINFTFYATDDAIVTYPEDSLPLAKIFPTRNSGETNLYLYFNDPIDVEIKVTYDSTGAVLYDKSFKELKDACIPIVIEDGENGIYNVEISFADRTIKRRFAIRK